MVVMFSTRLKELREMAKLSQRDIAKVFFVSQSAYCNWESGKNEPSLAVIMKICNYFEVTSDYLIGLSEI